MALKEIHSLKENDFEDLWESSLDTEMSETDRAAISGGDEKMQGEAFEKAVVLMKSHRRLLKQAARILIKRGVIEQTDLLDA